MKDGYTSGIFFIVIESDRLHQLKDVTRGTIAVLLEN